jgi:hypothetical protein
VVRQTAGFMTHASTLSGSDAHCPVAHAVCFVRGEDVRSLGTGRGKASLRACHFTGDVIVQYDRFLQEDSEE